MKIRNALSGSLAIAVASLAFAGATLPAAAQNGPGGYQQDGGPGGYHQDDGPGGYQRDGGPGMGSGMMMGRRQVSGVIASASPYRVMLARRGGRTIEVDLVHGTRIYPVGTNLSPGMHVIARGHWSKGTFIAERVSLR